MIQLHKFALAATFGLAVAFTLSCSLLGDDGGNFEYGSVADNNGKTYKTIKIGEQTWMAENLNYDVSGSACYENKPANCTKYGRLYDWETAMKVCPEGWHIPSNEDWDALMIFVNPSCADDIYNSDCEEVGTKLKTKSGWKNNGNGTNDYGFSALPGGRGSGTFWGGTGGFYGDEFSGDWWSSSEINSDYAYYREIDYFDVVRQQNTDKGSLFSVRCLQD